MKLLEKLFVFIVLMFIFLVRVEALSVSKSEVTIKSGGTDSVDLFLNVTEGKEVSSVQFDLVFSTYDVPGNFKVAEGYTNSGSGISHKIVFDTPVTGSVKIGSVSLNVVESPKEQSGTIRINNAKAITTTSEEVILTNPSITVVVNKESTPTIEVPSNDELVNNTPSEVPKIEDKKEEVKKEEETKKEEKTESTTTETTDSQSEDSDKKEEDKSVVKEEKKSVLKEIQSDLVKIRLKEDVFEYTVKVKEEVEELDLKPILDDDSYSVDISSQKISELKDGKIIISITKEEEKIEYVINVKVNNGDFLSDIEIDNGEGPKYEYKGKWIGLIITFVVILLGGLIFSKKK